MTNSIVYGAKLKIGILWSSRFLSGLMIWNILIWVALVATASPLIARNVYNFNVHGLKLNMNLDEVIKEFSINNVKVSKDSYGIVNGYEIKKNINDEKIVLVLNFTGEKRLYRIQYNKLFESYRFHSIDLYVAIKKKYGAPAFEKIETEGDETRSIYACWGLSCKTYPQTTPTMTVNIYYATGILRLRLIDNRIFNKDWKKYKDKYDAQKQERDKSLLEKRKKIDF